jgi:hypothetical protein
MNAWPLTFLLLIAPLVVAAQRPTAEAARSAVSFWPLDARTGAVVFVAPMSHPAVSALTQAEHVRAWLTQTCGPSWSELAGGVDSAQLYRGQLRGAHAGVELKFALRVSRQAGSWQYRLFTCEVRSPTGSEVVHWLPLHQLLDDPDFQPHVLSFQQQLQRTLPRL